jgi:hypothetical protein
MGIFTTTTDNLWNPIKHDTISKKKNQIVPEIQVIPDIKIDFSNLERVFIKTSNREEQKMYLAYEYEIMRFLNVVCRGYMKNELFGDYKPKKSFCMHNDLCKVSHCNLNHFKSNKTSGKCQLIKAAILNIKKYI